MTNQFAASDITLVAVRDYRLHSGYEYVISVEERDLPLERKGCFKTKAAAAKAGVAAAQKFIAPELF